MSVEKYIDLYADSPSELIELMQRIYPSSPNETNEDRCFLNEHINVYVHSLSEREIQLNEENYGVNVNHCLSIQYFSSSDCNSADELIYVMKQLVRMLNCDLLYQPNGDSPVIVRRSGILLFEAPLPKYRSK